MRRQGDWIEVTFSAPDISERSFRYRVGRRYLLVWGDGGTGQPHFVNLPRPVEPKQHLLSFVNGVVDARFRLR